jgi:hypothetical protein
MLHRGGALPVYPKLEKQDFLHWGVFSFLPISLTKQRNRETILIWIPY